MSATGEPQSESLAGIPVISLLDRITSDTGIGHGKPCVRHLRRPVEAVLDLLSADMTIAETRLAARSGSAYVD